MGAGELRSSFNTVSQPAFTCTMALLDYVHAHDVQSQVLTFSGTDAAGAPFSITSRAVRPNEDVNAVAAEVAQQLLDRETPK